MYRVRGIFVEATQCFQLEYAENTRLKNDEPCYHYFIYGILRAILLYQCMPNGFDDTHHLPLIKT
jgi:hypothetical protein